MNRRTFFKVVGSVAAVAGLPPGATKLIAIDETPQAGYAALGVIREMFAYDLGADRFLARFDVWCEDLQLSVDMAYSSESEAAARLPQDREIARALLEKELEKRGRAWAELRPLPLPAGYVPRMARA